MGALGLLAITLPQLCSSRTEYGACHYLSKYSSSNENHAVRKSALPTTCMAVGVMTNIAHTANPSSLLCFCILHHAIFIIHYPFLPTRIPPGNRGKRGAKSIIVMKASIYRVFPLNIHSRSSNTLALISRLVLNPKSQSLSPGCCHSKVYIQRHRGQTRRFDVLVKCHKTWFEEISCRDAVVLP